MAVVRGEDEQKRRHSPYSIYVVGLVHNVTSQGLGTDIKCFVDRDMLSCDGCYTNIGPWEIQA